MRDVIAKLNKYAKNSESSRGVMERKLDKIMSVLVRTDESAIAFIDDGCPMVKCYTCGRIYPWTKIDCGHYIPRHRNVTRWDFNNVRPQCTQCNSYHEGEHWIFRKRLVEELGLSVVTDLESKAELWGLKKMPVYDIDLLIKQWEPVAKWRLKVCKKPEQRPGLGLS